MYNINNILIFITNAPLSPEYSLIKNRVFKIKEILTKVEFLLFANKGKH